MKKLTIFFNNGEIYHGRVLILPSGGWVSSAEMLTSYIGNSKFFKGENEYIYPLSTISKMIDMSPEELRDLKINVTLEK